MSALDVGRDGGYEAHDIAAAHAILKAAGGEIFTQSGRPVTYRDDTTKVPPHFAAGIQTAIALGKTDKAFLSGGCLQK